MNGTEWQRTPCALVAVLVLVGLAGMAAILGAGLWAVLS